MKLPQAEVSPQANKTPGDNDLIGVLFESSRVSPERRTKVSLPLGGRIGPGISPWAKGALPFHGQLIRTTFTAPRILGDNMEIEEGGKVELGFCAQPSILVP
ncbi:hypothetical protein KM043_007877 [Ampulex compressa]|nr:hypothetical protein KM043_007877 [Ampulex compressa]